MFVLLCVGYCVCSVRLCSLFFVLCIHGLANVFASLLMLVLVFIFSSCRLLKLDVKMTTKERYNGTNR